jgi:hypothetical protein
MKTKEVDLVDIVTRNDIAALDKLIRSLGYVKKVEKAKPTTKKRAAQ